MNCSRWITVSAALAAVTIAHPAQAQTAVGGTTLWSHASGSGAENWNAKVVSIGDHGSQVLTSFGSFNDFTRLFSAYDQNPPVPVWQDSSGQTTQRHRVSSSKMADVHATLHDVHSGSPFNTRNVVVRKYTSSSGTPDWVYTFPEVTNGHDRTAVHVSDDGDCVAALMHNIYTGEVDVAVFTPDSDLTGGPAATYSVSVSGPMASSRLSSDGSTLMVRSNARIRLLNALDGTLRHDVFVLGGTPYADAISGDGSALAYSTYNDVKVYRENANGTFGAPAILDVDGTNYCGALDIDDGSTRVAMGFNYFNSANEFLTVRVQVRDLANTNVILVDDTLAGSGAHQNLVSDIELSSDGRRVAVGLWGDEAGLVPEVCVYATNQSEPIATFETPGSVNAVAFSADGTKLAVASKAVHANVVASGGRIDLYQIGERDLEMQGVPSIGNTVTFDLHGREGKHAVLLSAPALDDPPTVFGNIGTLHLKRTALSATPMGTVGSTEWISKDYTIPNNAALIGTTTYFQGFLSSPRELSKSFVAMTILP